MMILKYICYNNDNTFSYMPNSYQLWCMSKVKIPSHNATPLSCGLFGASLLRSEDQIFFKVYFQQ